MLLDRQNMIQCEMMDQGSTSLCLSVLGPVVSSRRGNIKKILYSPSSNPSILAYVLT